VCVGENLLDVLLNVGATALSVSIERLDVPTDERHEEVPLLAQVCVPGRDGGEDVAVDGAGCLGLTYSAHRRLVQAEQRRPLILVQRLENVASEFDVLVDTT
jgi:hypothetical protein